MERGMFAVVFEDRVSGLNYEENVILRRNMKAQVIKVHDAKSLLSCSVPILLLKVRQYDSVLDCHLADSNIAYTDRSRTGSTETREHQVFHEVIYDNIDKSYAIVFLARSLVAWQTLHHVYESRSASCNRCSDVSDSAQFVSQSWENGLTLNKKRVASAQWLPSLLHEVIIS